jgi:hypothetical protein
LLQEGRTSTVLLKKEFSIPSRQPWSRPYVPVNVMLLDAIMFVYKNLSL